MRFAIYIVIVVLAAVVVTVAEITFIPPGIGRMVLISITGFAIGFVGMMFLEKVFGPP